MKQHFPPTCLIEEEKKNTSMEIGTFCFPGNIFHPFCIFMQYPKMCIKYRCGNPANVLLTKKTRMILG